MSTGDSATADALHTQLVGSFSGFTFWLHEPPNDGLLWTILGAHSVPHGLFQTTVCRVCVTRLRAVGPSQSAKQREDATPNTHQSMSTSQVWVVWIRQSTQGVVVSFLGKRERSLPSQPRHFSLDGPDQVPSLHPPAFYGDAIIGRTP